MPSQHSIEVQQQFRRVFGHFASGVAVITTAGKMGPAGLTTTSLCSVSLKPLLLLVCLDCESRTLATIKEVNRFAVNILCENQRNIAVTFATKQGGEEKLAAVAHSTQYNVPVLDHALAKLICDVETLKETGDHAIVIATPIAMHITQEDAQPLLWFQSAFHSLSEAKSVQGLP